MTFHGEYDNKVAVSKKNPNRPVGLWEAIRDVLIESMRKGQLPPVAVGMVFALFLVKTPSDYYPTIWNKIFELRQTILVSSLVLNLVVCIGWFWNARSLRRTFQAENERIITERNLLQEKLGVSVESSE